MNGNDVPENMPAAEEPVVGDAPPRARVFFSNEVYDKLKFVALIVLPALSVFYLSVAPLWDFPKQAEVSGTIMAIDLLLGAVVGISNIQYKNSDARFDGQIVISPHEDEDAFNVRVQIPKTALATKDEVTVKIKRSDGV